MTNYLTLKKILLDTLALYKSHCLYITFFIGAVLGPYNLIVTSEELDNSVVILIPIFIVLMMLAEILSTTLASTGYVDKQFIIVDEIKNNIFRSFSYLFITVLGTLLSFFGIYMLVIPGLMAKIIFDIIKVDYVVSGRKINDSFKESFNMLRNGITIRVLKIYLLPILLQFLTGILLTPVMSSETFYQDILKLYPYVTVGLIVIFPVSICFRTSVYFNIIKERQLNSTNELV